jgi:hypothetical protein
MQQNVFVILNTAGIANGSAYSTQQPTVVFDDLPFSVWTALSSPRSVSGRVIGFADPTQYQVALFAAQSDTQFLGNAAWLASVATDGSFQIPVQQAAAHYIALLMLPTFAQSYFASTFPSGNATVSSLPSPADHPGDVVLMVAVPAGMNCSLKVEALPIPVLSPGQCWSNTNTTFPGAQLSPAPSTSGAPNPNDLTDPNQSQSLWYNYMLRGQSPATFTTILTTQRPDGTAGNGAFAAGVYVYGNTMYMVAGAGPRQGGNGTTLPVIVAAPVVDWNVFAPSQIQLNMTITVLPGRVMLSLDVMEVDPSLIATLLKALLQVEKDLFELLLAEL